MNTQDFLHRPVREIFFRYLLPSIFGTMVTSIYVLADTIMIGKGIGTVAMACPEHRPAGLQYFLRSWPSVRRRRFGADVYFHAEKEKSSRLTPISQPLCF